MIYLLLFLVLLYALWRFSRKEKGELVKDPYCGVYIPKDRAFKARIGGKTLFFCSRKCMESYKELRS